MGKLSKYLPLTNRIDGKKVRVDLDFQPLIGETLHVMGKEIILKTDAEGGFVLLRERLGLPKTGKLTFKNLDRFDYRRDNLEVSKAVAEKQSRFKGVRWNSAARRWAAGGRYFRSEVAAVQHLKDKKCPEHKADRD